MQDPVSGSHKDAIPPNKRKQTEKKTNWHIVSTAPLNTQSSVGAYTLNLAEGLIAKQQLVQIWSLARHQSNQDENKLR